MLSRRLVVPALPALLLAPLAAQEANLKIAGDRAEQISIEAKLKTKTDRKVLVDGEEMNFGGRGGGEAGGGRGGRRGGFGGFGGGETSIAQKIVFDQGPAGTDWRTYHVLEAAQTGTGRDGEPTETTVTGALVGKTVRIWQDETGETVLVEGEGESETTLPANLARGMTTYVDLTGLAPGKTLAVGDTYAIGKGLQRALAGLLQPVTPERRGRDEGADEGGEARGGGRGRGQGGRGQGGRGAGGRGGFARMGGGSTNQLMQIVQGGKVPCEGTGKLIAVEEKDGRTIATVEITAKFAAEGDPNEIGLGFGGGFGGRGGRGGGGGFGGGESEATGKVDITITGKAWIDVSSNSLHELQLGGEITTASRTKRTMGRDGEEREIDSTSTTTGEFTLQVSTAPAKQ